MKKVVLWHPRETSSAQSFTFRRILFIDELNDGFLGDKQQCDIKFKRSRLLSAKNDKNIHTDSSLANKSATCSYRIVFSRINTGKNVTFPLTKVIFPSVFYLSLRYS